MKKTAFLIIVLFGFSCKEHPKDADPIVEEEQLMKATPMAQYPESLQKVFNAHGGMQLWKSFRTLSYEIPKEAGAELHTLDLISRKDRIDAPNFAMGYNGENVWLLNPQQDYKGDAVFYHNLMSYFYAMPFILGDSGINYGATEDLIFEGVHYPGVSISYKSGVGTSPKDEYFIHYDPESYKMAWLGYTVTYRSGEKSENIKWIRYKDWINAEGLLLPKSITWHAYEGRDIKAAKSTVIFEKINVVESSRPNSFFDIPEGAKLVEGKMKQ